MNFLATKFPEVWVVEPDPHRDERGFFARTFCEREFQEKGLNAKWVQQNHTRTHGKGAVRGMHWQASPHEEIKLVRCLAGSVLDVVVDVRPQSATFGHWEAVELSEDNMRSVYIPEGFAHGFQCLSDHADLLYLMSDFYHADLACGLDCNDSDVGIAWPMPPCQLSARDAGLPSLRTLA